MKIAILHNHPIHYKHLLFLELKRRGLDCDIIYTAGRSSVRHEVVEPSDEPYRAHIGWMGSYETAPAWRRAVYPWRTLSELSPDVVVISGYQAIECWSAWAWAHLARKRIVLWFESNEFDHPRHWPKEILKRTFCQGVGRAHVYGKSNKEYLVRLGVPPDRIDLGRAAVDVDHFALPYARPLRDGREALRLLFVGRLAPEKNVSLLLRAFARSEAHAATRALRLIIAGSGPCEAELRNEAAGLGISDLVQFVGYTPQRDLPGLYRSADALVLPSTREPWGLVTLEAMLARMPVLVSRQCGCAADVVTPSNGWTFSPYDVDELAGLLTLLTKLEPRKVRSMGEASLEIATDYSIAKCADRVIRSLERLEPTAKPGNLPEHNRATTKRNSLRPP